MNRTVRKNSLLFLAGSGLYPLLEVLWRGYSHASMALAGGVCLLLINAVCCEKMKRRSLPARCAIGSLIITVVEFLFGLLVNRVLHLHVWVTPPCRSTSWARSVCRFRSSGSF